MAQQLEQLFNLYKSTLSGNYTAGSGTASVTSASGLPTSGSYTLTVLDQTTLAIKVVLHVTVRSGTTLTVTAEGSDANASSGDIIVGAMLTTRSIGAILASFGPTFTFLPPDSGAYTQQNYNTGTGVVTTQVNNPFSITLKQHDPSGTNNSVALDKAIIAATFTVTVAISLCASGNAGLAGLWISDGGSPPNNIFFGYQNASQFEGVFFTNFTNFSGFVFQTDSKVMAGPVLWLQIKETASNRFYNVSTDGITFTQIFSEANNAHFTTARYGICVQARSGTATAPDTQMTLWSWNETNP